MPPLTAHAFAATVCLASAKSTKPFAYCAPIAGPGGVRFFVMFLSGESWPESVKHRYVVFDKGGAAARA
jgi:hypothetical protein